MTEFTAEQIDLFANAWIDWHGTDWAGDPDQLVHVRFHDGEDDTHMSATPARNLGLTGEVSNWRWGHRNEMCVVAYRVA